MKDDPSAPTVATASSACIPAPVIAVLIAPTNSSAVLP